MTTIAYLRIAPIEQDLEKEKLALSKLADNKSLGQVIFVEEEIKRATSWKNRQIATVIEKLDAGDNLIATNLSSLGRSTLEIMHILVATLDKNINIYTIKSNWALDGTIPSDKLAKGFSLIIEIERAIISNRTKEALAAKKAAGVKLGKPKGTIQKSKLDKFRPEIEQLLINGSSQKYIAKRYDTSPVNLSQWMKKHGLRKGQR